MLSLSRGTLELAPVLLHRTLAARGDTASDEHSYGDNTAVWFESGTKVLDYARSDHRFNPESFKDCLEEQGVLVERDALAPPLANMKSLSNEWRDSIGENGYWSFMSTIGDDLVERTSHRTVTQHSDRPACPIA